MKESIFEYIREQYNVDPDYPWDRDPESAVFRHKDNKKWFALIMNVPKDKLGIDSNEIVTVINLKIDDFFLRDMLIKEEGIIPSYHMNKQHWITVLLDGTVKKDNVFSLIDVSYNATSSAKRKIASREPKEWIIPSNPKYYDVIQAFENNDEIEWKQGRGILTGDIIYLYVGAPVSAILYKCRVTETDIPYEYSNGKLTINSLMKIKLLKRYDSDLFTFDVLKEEYGINAVRGPRGIPYSLQEALG